MNLVLIDYGVGNIFSVSRALHSLGAEFQVTADLDVIENATHLILPGVGSFGACAAEIEKLGLEDKIRRHSISGRPLLAICVGMQLLLDESDEFGRASGLGLIGGVVRKISEEGAGGARRKIPHVGWSAIEPPDRRQDWDDGVLKDAKRGEHFYFLHSFAAKPADPANLIATTRHGGLDIAACVRVRNTYGVQFHPEKSGPAGLSVLRNFMLL